MAFLCANNAIWATHCRDWQKRRLKVVASKYLFRNFVRLLVAFATEKAFFLLLTQY